MGQTIATALQLNSINPFTAKFSQKQISTIFPNFILRNFEKQIAPCVSTGRELLFQWPYCKIPSANSKVRVTLQNSIEHFRREKVKWSPSFPMSSYCLIAIMFVRLPFKSECIIHA